MYGHTDDQVDVHSRRGDDPGAGGDGAALAPGPAEDRRLGAWRGEGMGVGTGAVCWAEFLCGPVLTSALDLAARIVPDPPPFTAVDAASTASLFDVGGRRRGSFVDCM